MRFDIMTLFPGLVDTVLGESIIGRAQKSGAITVKDFLAEIDYSKCTNCGKCVEKCPRHIIR